MPETNETKKSNGLAIASFVLALVGGFLCLTLIGLPLGVLCWILAFIFGIVALCKKQTKRASILGIIFSLLGTIILVVCTSFIGKFVVQHKDQIVNPLAEFSTRAEANPEIAKLMEDEDFGDNFEKLLQEKLEEKYGNNYNDIKDLDGVFEIWNDVFEEMKNIATELAEQQGISTNETPNVGIANPAAEFCVAQGGESYIVEDEDGAQRGMCRLSDGSEMDEWEYFNAIADVTSDIIAGTENEVKACGDFYKTEEEISCNMIYAPVCGNDGNTYGNDCVACSTEGVDSYTDGECNAD